MDNAGSTNNVWTIIKGLAKSNKNIKLLNLAESLMARTDVAILMIKRALNAGICADYVLMDTWFTTEHMIRSILVEGRDVIGMVK